MQSGSVPVGEVRLSVVSGQLFTIDSVSHINVLSDSSSSCVPSSSSKALRTFRTVLIACRRNVRLELYPIAFFPD